MSEYHPLRTSPQSLVKIPSYTWPLRGTP